MRYATSQHWSHPWSWPVGAPYTYLPPGVAALLLCLTANRTLRHLSLEGNADISKPLLQQLDSALQVSICYSLPLSPIIGQFRTLNVLCTGPAPT